MCKVLNDAMAAVSAIAARGDVDTGAIGVLGHSYGGTTALFLAAVDDRIRFGCSSGAVASYRRRIADGTGIELASVIPGFTTRFDLEHVLAAVAPRPFLVVSGSDDKYSADADVVSAFPAPPTADGRRRSFTSARRPRTPSTSRASTPSSIG